MRSLSAILLFATACGSDLTTLEVTCGAAAETIPETNFIQPIVEVAETTSGRPLAHPLPTDPPVVTQAPVRESPRVLVLSPSDELLGAVRASVKRFAERLKIPVVVGEGGIPITVQDTVLYKGRAVTAMAYYSRYCVFSDCNRVASIAVERALLNDKIDWLAQMLDHEIGHILSAWGRIKKVNMHIAEDYHVMTAGVRRAVQWTQEDIDLWCSASPCGRTELGEEWTYPVLPLPDAVADSGTSILSDGVDAGGNVGGLTDAGL